MLAASVGLLALLTSCAGVQSQPSGATRTITVGNETARSTPVGKRLLGESAVSVLAGFGRQLRAQLGPPCNTDSVRIEPLQAVLMPDFEFPSTAQHPTAGHWYWRFQYEACGTRSIYNIGMKADAGRSPLLAITFPPGETRLDFKEQLEIAPGVLAAAAVGHDPQCKPGIVVDTSNFVETLPEPDEDPRTATSWNEVWYVRLCDKTQLVSVSRLPPIFDAKPTLGVRPISSGPKPVYYSPRLANTKPAVPLKIWGGQIGCVHSAIETVSEHRRQGIWRRLLDNPKINTQRVCVAAAICDTYDFEANFAYESMSHRFPGKVSPIGGPPDGTPSWRQACAGVGDYIDYFFVNEPEFIAATSRGLRLIRAHFENRK